MRSILLVAAAAALLVGAYAVATETITYTYDTKGRVISVVRTGTVNNNVTTVYTHDKANNRATVVRTKPP
jgi:YD repeat-containing protein